MNILTEGTTVTVMGLCVVFAVLIILWGLLELFRTFFSGKNKKGKSHEVTAVVSAIELTDDELVAVITGALASCLNTSTYRLRIKSLRQVEGRAPIWNRISRRENIEN